MAEADADGAFGPFALAGTPSTSSEDFLVSDANAGAFQSVTSGEWRDGRLALSGPASSGKSHLASIWAAQAGVPHVAAENLLAALPKVGASPGLAVDDADRVASRSDLEAALLHMLNIMSDRGGKVLLVSRTPPARWPVKLADLRSRLEATTLARINLPDDRLLGGVLVKLFADRLVAVPAAVVEYVVPRMERSYSEAARIVFEMDRRALAEGRRINRRLAADVLNGDTD